MTEAKSTLDKVMAVLGMQAPVAEVAAPEEVAEPAVELAEPMIPEEEKVPAEEEEKVEEKMSVEDMISALDAKIAALTDMVSKLVAEEVSDEPEALLPAAPVPTAMAKKKKAMEMSAAQPKFNGAPVEENKVDAAMKVQVTGTMSTVLQRLYGN